ncbi:gliding motility-associated C-terminal domain-containing protein [Mucilaginibacter sp. HMF5004]|uniref:T9SS type B sorting domain-containing protein n=1 Tax=Mucilaginibacter rivuli TaxID=2857527 RepID=UPI001C5D5259|nr:gliding motility-associated C-terminal domain-containing protein [Mucilaginibacter rivuli]MBW4890293.1 gliding motility-associated C-terminal domain-containing protein [Mucilaginibacter rivuli]
MLIRIPFYWLGFIKRLFCCFVWLIAIPAFVFAEGSKDLNANGGNRAYLYSGTGASASFPFPNKGTLKVYAKVGESIYMGSSAQGIGGGTMIIRSPDGKTYTSGTSATVGLIANITQEFAGPLPNTNGYTPFIQPVLAGQDGVWEIDFIPVNTSLTVTPIASAANWVQPASQCITAFDITVRDAGNSFLTGRVYTNIFMGYLGAFDVGFNAVVKILTKDGYLYNLDNNGQAGNGFSFFSNNKGFRNTNGTPSYKSVDNVTTFDVQDPRAEDTQSDVTHKIFFNTPAADLPATAATPTGTTWLANTPFIPSITNATFTGMEGTPNLAGTSPLGGNITFTSTGNGAYTISIDINKNGVFNDPIDRTITGTVTAGGNTIYWDGRDGLGNKAPAGISIYNINIYVNVYAGEVHFPCFDVERNVNGIKLTRLNGFGSPDYTVYWNDAPITVVGAGTPSVPVTNLIGISSLINGHKWGTPGAGDSEYGNEKSIDTWAYVAAAPLLATTGFKLQEADLQVAGISTAPVCIGQSFTATVTIKNNGPSDVTGAKVNLAFPGVIGNVNISSAATSGTSSLSAVTTSATAYNATLSIANGAVITFTIAGTTVNVTSAGNNTISASILRPADLTDPDATNPDASPPTDANAECDSPPSGTGCNNIQNTVISILVKPAAGTGQTIVKNTMATLTGTGTGVWSQAGITPAVANIASPASTTTTVTGLSLAGNYKFVFTNPLSCTDTVVIRVLNDINIPNIITPNGDGKNDVLEIAGISSYPNSELLIFNRWGAEVYRSENYLNTWNGSGLAEGTYYYIFNRKEASGGTTTFKGWVYLKR